jgi:MFS family permease
MGTTRATRSPLWQDRVYRRVWTGHTVAQSGSAIGEFVLPLLAARTLGASPTQVGLLLASQTIPLLVLGLFVGVLVDRRPRLPLMVAADVSRAALLGLIPLTWWLDLLSFPLLVAIVMLTGLCNVLFDVSSQALVNSILPRHLLVLGNARILSSYAFAEILGPAVGGALLRFASAPVAFALNAATYALAAVALIGARGHERVTRANPDEAGDVAGRGRVRAVLRDVQAGIRFVFATPTLRTLTVGVALWNLGSNAARGMVLLFLVDELGLDPAVAGLFVTLGGIGGLAATVWPQALTRRLGLGRGILAAVLLSVPGLATIAAAGGPGWLVVTMLAVGYLVYELASVLADVNQFVLRNAVTPDRFRGRVASAARVILRSTVPLGFLLGGLIADVVGLRAAVAFGVVGPLAFACLLLRSPIVAMRELPRSPDDPTDEATDPEGVDGDHQSRSVAR